MSRRGFTLLELSLVLMIIGLIIGAIFAGRSIIRSSELQSAISDTKAYTDSIRMFRDKYKSLPGDMTNASSMWAGTSNGNGDGITGAAVSISAHQAGNLEVIYAWQHLYKAGLVQTAFTGTAPTSLLVPGTNIPKAAVGDDVGIDFRNVTQYGADVAGLYNTLYSGKSQHVFVLGKSYINEGYTPMNAALSPVDSYEIDRKIDDGTPGQGKVAVVLIDLTKCVTSSTAASAAYKTTTDIGCSLVFLTDL